MSQPYTKIGALIALLGCASAAHAVAWISFTNQTSTRMPTGAGQNDPTVTTADPREKDYAWGDVDHDGDLDLLCVRKQPLSCVGGYRNVLFMNEGGILMDRTSVYGVAALGVPADQGVSQGLMDATNDRQAVLVDLNNDGWLDIVTATTMSDGLKQYIGHPRVYMNLGSSGGVWQGFRYEYDRIPTLSNKTGGFAVPPAVYNPRFCSVSAGDVTGDGYVDLYFVDYDTPEACYCPPVAENASNDMDNKLLINQGAANPGYFNDESLARMNASCGSCGGNLLFSHFGAHGLIADFNGDGLKDVLKITTLDPPNYIAVLTNPPATPGNWTASSYKQIYGGAPYSVATADLNGDGKLDVIISDDSVDRYGLNTGNDGNGNPNVTTFTVNSPSEFSGQNTLVDLDNDGWPDAIIPDQDLDTNYVTSRRTHIYHNMGPGASPQLAEDNTNPVIPQASAKAVYQVAVFDIDGDGWRDVILGKGNPAGGHTVGSTEVWMSNGKPGLSFSYPGGKPTNLTPNTAATFNVQLTGTFGGVPAGSANIVMSVNGGAFTSTAMAPLGGDLYQATIPAQPCGVDVRYYFSGQLTVGSTVFTDPAKAPVGSFSAAASESISSLVAEDFEGAASGWTVVNDPSLTGGQWELGVPIGTWNEGFKAAPDSNATPGGSKAFVTGLGVAGGALNASDVDGGPTSLISPTIDLSSGNATISFQHWFYSSTQGDVLQVSVSNDNGANWVNVTSYKGPPVTNWNGPAEYTQTAWQFDSFVVGDFVTPTAQVKVRFTANDVTPAGIVEAGIDDFHVDVLNCTPPPPPCAADVTQDNTVNTADLLAVINAWGPCKGCTADVNGDGSVNTADLLSVINAWGACP